MSVSVILPPRANAVEIEHLADRENDWCVSESRHFRLFHSARPPVAEKVLTLAEETKARMQAKWFAGQRPHWQRRLPILLYPDAETYRSRTGFCPLTPGHASIRTEDARMTAGRIDMHADAGNFISSVLPHEVTHAVIGANFSKTPRWADEGMAMLSEEAKHVKNYLREIAKFRQRSCLLPLTELIQLKEYPADSEARYRFYCESVSLVSFLAELNSPRQFIQFIRDSYRQGYAAAFRQNFGFADFQEAEERWLEQACRKGRKR